VNADAAAQLRIDPAVASLKSAGPTSDDMVDGINGIKRLLLQ
jgi:hypothetical protein